MAARKINNRRRTTPLQDIEIAAWYRAKKALGTEKSQARVMGLPKNVFAASVKRARKADI